MGRVMKNILILPFLILGSSFVEKAFAADTVCSLWVQNSSVSCLFGDGEDGTSWKRNCSLGSSTCKPHRQDPPGTPCQSESLCLGREPGDVSDPNTLQNVCTDWRLAERQNVACPDGHQSRWVRACTMEHLATKTCSVDQPPNIP